MVGKRSGKALLREEGLERTDNNMDLTAWPQINMINQKNYYTEYLKRDDQILPLRLLQEERRDRMTSKAKEKDRARNQDDNAEVADVDMEDDAADDGVDASTSAEALGSKVLIIHPGSQNLRIGLANDAWAKTIPMVIARRSEKSESEDDGGEPLPKRLKTEDGQLRPPEQMFGEEFSAQYTKMCADLKIRMRANKRRVLPNSKEVVVNYNRRAPTEDISEHNDPMRIEWTELPPDRKSAPPFFTGHQALRIPDDSIPRYKLYWPLRHGWYNEKDYRDQRDLFNDISTIIESAIKSELNLVRRREWAQYSCIFIIPDLYEKKYVTQALDMLMRDFGFARVAFIQESLAATFGAGYSISCIVDIGAQKTSVCCVEEGMCVENSRINLKWGAQDITETFIKMMLYDHFPYEDINLRRRYDFLLAEELKKKFCTLNETDISPQLFEFHLRVSGRDTKKYSFKTYDEVLLAPHGYFQPTIFDNSHKLEGRRRLIGPSVDLYDGSPNDPVSAAQSALIAQLSPVLPSDNLLGEDLTNGTPVPALPKSSTAALQNAHEADRASVSAMGTPAPEDEDISMQPGETSAATDGAVATVRDDVLPVMALDAAIISSLTHAARNDERKFRDFFSSIMAVGGGTLVPGFYTALEERLKILRPGLAKEFTIGTPPRDLDPQGVVWKGGSVFGKLSGTNDSWIGRIEYDRLGARVLPYKCMWAW